MKAVITEVYSSDVVDFITWSPDSLEEVYFPLDLTISLPGDIGGEVFEIMVVTPEALRSHTELGFCFPGRHYLIVSNYDWNKILSAVQELVDQCEGDSWQDIVELLRRYFYWEYEDHQENIDEEY